MHVFTSSPSTLYSTTKILPGNCKPMVINTLTEEEHIILDKLHVEIKDKMVCTLLNIS